MNIKNLERAAQIAEQLPLLEEARKILSDTIRSKVIVEGRTEKTCSAPTVVLPKTVNYNILTVLNSEINRMKDEIKNL